MSQILKKTLSGIASVTTILWSVGGGLLALPGVASAATISAGDLIKASGPSVYYYGSDSKRYTFPNETTYKSWYADFSSVKTITDSELAAIPFGSNNVTIRPGTKLVKITTDPKVYAVAPGGVLRWIETEAIATALYGSNWARRVVDVPDSFFVNYTVGSSVSSAVHPDGSLVMYSTGPEKYVVWGGQKRLLSDSAFMANGFQMSDVIVTTASYPNGTEVMGREAALADTVRGGSTPAPVGGALTVSLASDTPAGVTVPKNSASVQLAKFNLMAGSGDVTVTGLRFRRVGVGATSDFSNVYVYDTNGARLTTGRSVNSSSNLVEFNSLNIMVPAGQTKSVILVGDFSNPSSTGGQHSFELVDAASVVVTGSSTVSGSFPVRGNVFTVGTSSAARLDVQKGTTPSNPNIGAMEAEISNFKLVANTNDIEVRRITLLQSGSVTNTDLTNLKLYQGSTLVASAAGLTGDKIVLNFNPPYVIANGQTRVFSLKANVGGRATRTIKTYVEYTTDVYAIDKTYNAGAAVCISSSSGQGGCTASSQGSFDGSSTDYIEVTTQGGQLTTTFNGPTTGNIGKGAQDVPLFRFSLASPDNDLEIKNINFEIESTNSGRIRGASNTDYFRDIKLKNLTTGATVMGPISLPTTLSSNSDSGQMSFTDSFVIRKGQVLDLAITADLSNSEDSDVNFFTNGTSTYRVVLGDTTYLFDSDDVRVVETGENLALSRIVPNANITGNNFTVKSSSLTLALGSSISSGSTVRNSGMIPAAAFVLTAGTESDVKITAFQLTGRGSTTGAYTLALLDDVVLSCGLYDGDTRLGLAGTPDATTGAITISNVDLNIARGMSKTVVAKCTADSTIVDTTAGDQFAVGISSVTAQDADSNTLSVSIPTSVSNQYGATPTIAQTVTEGGALTVATNNLRTSTILVSGTDTWQNFAEYRATAQNEAVRIEQIAVSSTGDAANFSAVAVAMDGAVKGWDILPSGQLTYKTVDFTSSPIVVAKNSSVTFQLWGKLQAVSASSTVLGATSNVARSGNTAALGIANGITSGNQWTSSYLDKMNVRAVGNESGTLIYATSSSMGSTALSGNSFVVRKSKPTVTRQALSTTTLASGQSMDLYKFQVSADAAGAVALKKVTFNVSVSTSTGSGLTLSNFRVRRGSTTLASSAATITNRQGDDLYAGNFNTSHAANTSTAGLVVVVFTSEETISGSGNVYTLAADVSGSVLTGDQVSTSLTRSHDTATVSGYLTSSAFNGSGASGLIGPNINTDVAPGSGTTSTADFIWSDISEIPHSDAAGSSNGSRDWFNGYLVDDLTQSVTISK